MLAKVGYIAQLIESLAPRRLAEEWDNVGLQVGDSSREVARVLVTLDLTDKVLDEAISTDCRLVVAHHPLIYKPLKHLRPDTPQGRRLVRLIREDIALYVAHTNYDMAKGGTADVLAAALNLQDAEILAPSGEEKYLKLVVFVPRGHEDRVRDALAEAGAGWIGNYSHCTFQTGGTGTFMAREGANPFLGQIGELEKAEEFRLETILPESISRRVVQAMIEAHPYEEVAYDLYPLANSGRTYGAARLGSLPEARTLADLAGVVKTVLEVPWVRVAGDPAKKVVKVAVVPGSAGSFIGKAAFAGADVLVGGDLDYHDVREALDAGMAVIDPGHYASEVLALPSLVLYLEGKLRDGGYGTTVSLSANGSDPFSVA